MQAIRRAVGTFRPPGLSLVTLAIILLSLAPITASADAVMPGRAPDPASLDAYLAAQVAAHRLAGVAVAITQGDEVVYLRGFGSAGRGRPMTPQTQLPIASSSKGFAALAIMQLVEQGKISLDAPVQTYLPWWRVAEPQASASITVRQLLNQTSGLSYEGYDDPSSSRRLPPETSLEDAVRDLKSARPIYEPGTTFDYFDQNYTTLSLIVQAVSGQPYMDYVHGHILRPLAMTRTINLVTDSTEDMAEGYNPLFTVPVRVPEVIDEKYLVGCCGIVTTAEDMSHYVIAQLNGGSYGDARILASESIQLLHAPSGAHGFPYSPFGYTGYGMGWFVRDQAKVPVLESPGSHRTYVADVVLLPQQGYGIVLLYNEGGLLTQIFGRQLLDGLVSLLLTGDLPGSGLSLGLVSLVLALLSVASLALEMRAMRRLGRWAEKVGTRPAWALVLGIAWPFLLAGLCAAVLVAFHESFPFALPEMLLWMPDGLGWLLLLGTLSIVLGVGRAWAGLRRARSGRKALSAQAEVAV